jgi:hypothetical protein
MEKKEKVHSVAVTKLNISRPFLKVFVRNLKGKGTAKLDRLHDLYEAAENRPLKPTDRCIVRMNSRRFERCQYIQQLGMRVHVYLDDCACYGYVEASEVSSIRNRKNSNNSFSVSYSSALSTTRNFVLCPASATK